MVSMYDHKCSFTFLQQTIISTSLLNNIFNYWQYSPLGAYGIAIHFTGDTIDNIYFNDMHPTIVLEMLKCSFILIQLVFWSNYTKACRKSFNAAI